MYNNNTLPATTNLLDSLSKSEDTNEKNEFCCDWVQLNWEKLKHAVDDIKNSVSEVKDWKKHWFKCIISEGGYFEVDNIVINK